MEILCLFWLVGMVDIIESVFVVLIFGVVFDGGGIIMVGVFGGGGSLVMFVFGLG